MKKSIIVIFSLTSFLFVSAQETAPISISNMGNDLGSLGVKSGYKRELNQEGTPFQYENYNSAIVGSKKTAISLRYNAYLDAFEFLNNGQSTVMAKEDVYSPIVFQTNTDIATLENYNYNGKEQRGYLFSFSKIGDKKVYRKVSKSYIKAKYATSSFDRDQPPTYKDLPDVYFLQDDSGKIVEFPDTKKKLISMFPSQKENISALVKGNKINYSDLVIVINLLNRKN